MSVGPFEDPRDFLRFLLVSVLGCLAGMIWGIWVLVPFLLVAAVLTLVRSGEETWWVVLHRWLRYILRPRRSRIPFPPSWPPRGRCARSRWFDLAGRPWKVWEAAPLPVSGRDPDDLLAESARLLGELGREDDEVLFYRVPEPFDIAQFLPPRADPGADEREVRAGYAALLRASVRGRSRVRLLLAFAEPSSSFDGPRRALAPVSTLADLQALGWRELGPRELPDAVRAICPLSGAP